MMEIENEKRLWDGENSFKGSRMHQRQRIPQMVSTRAVLMTMSKFRQSFQITEILVICMP